MYKWLFVWVFSFVRNFLRYFCLLNFFHFFSYSRSLEIVMYEEWKDPCAQICTQTIYKFTKAFYSIFPHFPFGNLFSCTFIFTFAFDLLFYLFVFFFDFIVVAAVSLSMVFVLFVLFDFPSSFFYSKYMFFTLFMCNSNNIPCDMFFAPLFRFSFNTAEFFYVVCAPFLLLIFVLFLLLFCWFCSILL